ncbi:MAG: hypothetical protein JSV82_02515 [Planctomycetota bacterium]|nr:MAG: hypothetical protein JSV82_02515 [Planctomycetota bacterium]
MDCSCDVGFDDYGDYPEFYNESTPIARKEHKCFECGRMITKGEKYHCASGKWNIKIETYKTCGDCLSIREQFFGNGWNFGNVIWDLEEHISETDAGLSQECIAKLTPVARNRVCDMIQKYWERREEGD